MVKHIIVPSSSEDDVKKQLVFQKEKLVKDGKEIVSTRYFKSGNESMYYIEISYKEPDVVSKFIDISKDISEATFEVVFGTRGEENGIPFVDATVIVSKGSWKDFHYFRFLKKKDGYELELMEVTQVSHILSCLKSGIYLWNNISEKELDLVFSVNPVYYY